MTPSSYLGPSVYGYETDAPLRRVAHISVHTSPLALLGGKDAGGMNVYVRELACHLAGLGLAIDVFTRRTSPDTPEIAPLCPGVNVVAVAAGPPEPLDKNALFPLLPEFAAEMTRFALRQHLRYDLVHAHYWLSGWVAHLITREWDAPFVQMFHTTAHRKNAVAAGSERESELRLQTEHRLLGLADGLIAANPDECTDLIWRHRAAATKIRTIPPGVDLDLFRPRDRSAARAHLGLPLAEQVALFVGRVDPIKGIDTLLAAVALLAQDDRVAPKPTLVFVGGDVDRAGEPVGPLAAVARQAATLGIADRFRFVGSQPQEDLPTYYAAADLVVVPSRYESFGLVAVEAMACGIPVVASRVGGLGFTVEDGESGLLVPPDSPLALATALASLLRDDERRRAMANHARRATERFAWPAVASAMLRAYRAWLPDLPAD